MTSILKVSEIQDPTNSNTALTIDSSGRVTMANKPFVSAAWDGSSTSTFAGSRDIYTAYETADHNLISGNHTIFYKNDFSMLNTSTGVVTIPVTGIYLIVGHYADESGTAVRRIGELYKNNARLGEWQESYGQYDDQSAVKMLYLSANDTIQFGHNNLFPYDDFGFEMVLLG